MDTPRKNGFLPMCSTGDKPGPPPRGAFSPDGDGVKPREVGKWRLGYAGKLSQKVGYRSTGCESEVLDDDPVSLCPGVTEASALYIKPVLFTVCHIGGRKLIAPSKL